MKLFIELFAGISPVFIVLALLGQFMNILIRLKKVFLSKDFQWKKWIAENLIQTVISFIGMVVLMIIFKSQLNEITALTIGYSTDNLLKQVMGTGQKQLKYPTR